VSDELDVGSLAATRACTRELEERGGELAVLGVELHVDERLLAGYFRGAVVPLGLYVELRLQGLHLQGLHALLAWAYVDTVAAAEAVEHVDGLQEAHTGECLADGRDGLVLGEGSGCHLGGIEYEGTDGGVRADIGALVALYAVL